MEPRIVTREYLDEAQRHQVLAAATAWAQANGNEALPEQVLMAVMAGDHALHLLDADGLSYAQLRTHGSSLELFALGGRPTFEQVAAAIEAAGRAGLPLAIWRRGITPGEPTFDDPRFVLTRTILLLGRSLPVAEEPVLPPSFNFRDFVVGRDEGRWLDVNALAFAEHPEQGAVDRDEVRRRMTADWFDPHGFIVAWHDSNLMGSCWTKMHRGPDGQIGEIYVISVSPDASGKGLGRALVLEGLHRLEAAGATRAILYVEDDNKPALALYGSLGFEQLSSDQQWQLAP